MPCDYNSWFYYSKSYWAFESASWGNEKSIFQGTQEEMETEEQMSTR